MQVQDATNQRTRQYEIADVPVQPEKKFVHETRRVAYDDTISIFGMGKIILPPFAGTRPHDAPNCHENAKEDQEIAGLSACASVSEIIE